MKKFKTLAVVLVISLCLFGVMTGCNEPDSGTELKLKCNDQNIGNSLSVDLSDGPLAFTANIDFTLASSNTEVAAVSGKTVTLVKAGEATITATAGDKKQDITLNVEEITAAGIPVPYFITNNFAQDTSTGLIAQWHNDTTVATQKLQIAPETGGFGNAKTITVTGNKFEGTDATIGNYEARNIFRTEVTGLSPKTRYKYRMGDKGAWSEIYYHLTSSGVADDFSFTVASDPQAPTHGRMGETLQAADDFDPDNRFYLMGGDIVDYIGAQPSEIASYTNAASAFNKYKPIAATQGNHDTYYAIPSIENGGEVGNTNNYRFGESTVFNAFVTYPANGRVKGADETNNTSQSYYFYYNKVLIVVLNTFAEKGPSHATPTGPDPDYSAEAEWLKGVLEKDKKGNLSRYKIVLTHVSPFSGRSVERWLADLTRAAFGKICTDYNVDIFFAGHCHVYTRSNPIKIVGTTKEDSTLDKQNFNITPNGTIFSIVSATGPKFYGLDNPSTDPYVDNDNKGGTGQYYVIQVSEGASSTGAGIYVNVKVTAAKLSVTAKRYDGTVLDTYDVLKK